MVKKNILAVALLSLSSISAMAGGLLTNTNQNAAYVRQLSQGGIIDITGLYFNPAGTAFLSDGWHLSLNSQTAFQQRNIETTFPLFAYNQAAPGETTHRFEGRAKAPVIPSFSLSYNKDKWSVNAHFGLIGGGGKCEFAKGLGSFEALYASKLFANQTMFTTGVQNALPGIVSAGIQAQGVDAATADMLASTGNYSTTFAGYSMDSYMKGRSYYFGLQLGATYKFMENLAGFVGLRGVYATCNYNGYVQDVKGHVAFQYDVPAIPGMFSGITTQNGVTSVDANSDLTLNADQVGFGVSPVIGIDYKINDKVNVAAKYEAPTVMKLKNSSEMNAVAQAEIAAGNETLGKFADGKKIREDIPGMLTLGIQYNPIEKLHLMGTFNEYFDKSAKKEGDLQKTQIDKNTWEIILGAEYDVHKYVTVSASWQNTNYGLSEAGMNDLSFNLSSNMIGLGLRINATERCSIDLGYMHTFYQDRTVNAVVGQLPTGAPLVKTDNYERKNDVFGIGVNLKF